MKSKFERLVYWWDTGAETDYDLKLRYTTYAQQLTDIINNYSGTFAKKERSMLEKEADVKKHYRRFAVCLDNQTMNFATAEQAKEAALDCMNSDADEYNTNYCHVGDTVEITTFDYRLSDSDKKGVNCE